MAEPRRRLVEQPRQRLGRGTQAQEGEVGPQALVVGTRAHAGTSLGRPRKGQGTISASASRSTRVHVMAPRRRARSARAATPGGRLALRSHGRAVLNCARTTASRPPPARGAHRGPCPLRGQAVAGKEQAGGSEDLQIAGAEALAHRDEHPGEARVDPVAVAPEGHAGLSSTTGWISMTRRIGRRRQRQQRLGVGQLADRRPARRRPGEHLGGR